MKKIKELKRNFTQMWTQKVANLLIKKIKNSESDVEFEFWMDQAYKLDSFCVGQYIYLD